MNSLTNLPKPLAFALVGAVGCLFGAAAGELLLLATYKAPPPPPPPPPPAPPQSVCLLIDCSGSMNGGPLREVKTAAHRFLNHFDLSRDQAAVVGFGGAVHRMAGLNATLTELGRAVDALNDGGSTRMDLGLIEARSQLANRKGEPVILLFTDGMPDDQGRALEEAQLTRASGVKIIAIAAGNADSGFLGRVTGNPSQVITTSAGGFGHAFEQAGESIFGHQLLQSGKSGAYTYGEAVLRVGIWTSALALPLVVFLAGYQGFLLQRTPPPAARLMLLAAAGLGAGLAAGVFGQLLFSVLAVLGPLEVLGRILGWGVLGALIARAMAFVIPNVNARKSWLGGAVGGGLGGAGFVLMSSILGDVGGRVAGALSIGACIGLLVGLVEVQFREAWLVVAFGPMEQRTVSLGAEPVTVGSSSACTVYAPGAAPLAATISLAAGRIAFCDEAGASTTVAPGQWLKLGNVAVAINTPEARADTSQLNSLFPPTQQRAVGAPVELQKGLSGVPSSGSPAFQLRLPSGKCILLEAGSDVIGSDFGLTAAPTSAIGRVIAHPTDANVIGLQNLSPSGWTASDLTGKKAIIAPGGTISLKPGIRLDLGFSTAEVVRCG